MAPLQYLNVKPGQKVELNVAHRSDEDYTPPPKAPIKAFSGQGQRLGSITPSAPSSSGGIVPTLSSTIKIQLNENEPQTSIQIRLGDGTR